MTSIEMQSTRERIADACMNKRAKLIDCNTCANKAVCDFIHKEEDGVDKIIDGRSLIDLSERYFL